MSIGNNDTRTEAVERLDDLMAQLSAAGVNPLEFANQLNKTKRRAWALDNVLSHIFSEDEDEDALGAAVRQLVEDVVMGIERLAEKFDAARQLARNLEAQS